MPREGAGRRADGAAGTRRGTGAGKGDGKGAGKGAGMGAGMGAGKHRPTGAARADRAPGKRPATSARTPASSDRPIPLATAVAALERKYGAPGRPRVTDPWEQILLENASYLVDDERRHAVLDRLRRDVGLRPEAILGAPRKRLERAIADGGMLPPMRAAKLVRAATLAQEVGEPLSAVLARGFDGARRVLKRFPGIADAGAERVALIAGALPVVALESNALRVLVRLGFGAEEDTWVKTWRAVRARIDAEAPRDAAWCLRAHQLLRRHGQETCRNTKPRCSACPLADRCPSAE